MNETDALELIRELRLMGVKVSTAIEMRICGDDSRFDQIDSSIASLRRLIKSQGDAIMATQAEFGAVLTRIDTATNEVAADLQALRDQIAGAGMSAEDEAAILAGLDAAASRLEGIGRDPENPVPVEGGGEGGTGGGTGEGGDGGTS